MKLLHHTTITFHYFLLLLLLSTTNFIFITNAFVIPKVVTTCFSTKKIYFLQTPTPTTITKTTKQSHYYKKMMESDFASAMPDKPTMSSKQKMIEKVTNFIVDLESKLSPNVTPPPELNLLKQARDDDNVDERTLAIHVYELMIEQGMMYDQDPNTGQLTPTEFDIKSNLDVPEVKQEFAYLYKYGMNLCLAGIIDVDQVKEIVMKRLIERTGLSPEEFDKWLGY